MIVEGAAMPAVQAFPPPPEVVTSMLAVPGIQISPTMLAIQQGPEGQLGPEAAGALLILQATFTDPGRAEKFWGAASGLMALLEHAPGFIRRYSFPEGQSITLIALWRTADDAKAFAATREHRAAVTDLYRERWQYSHFSAIWEMTSNHGRLVFCQHCPGITPATEENCEQCGTELVDVFRTPA
jgi:heme-degrading monooxygenase HmoA